MGGFIASRHIFHDAQRGIERTVPGLDNHPKFGLRAWVGRPPAVAFCRQLAGVRARRFSSERGMERKRVNSSYIRSAGYDASSQTLEVEFASGSIVQYQRVPAEVYRRFMAAPSPTSYFRDEIEESYTARRIR